MLCCIEEVEFGDNEGLDQHDRTGSNDSQKCDYVDDSYDIKHDVASAGQRLAKASHFEIEVYHRLDEAVVWRYVSKDAEVLRAIQVLDGGR